MNAGTSDVRQIFCKNLSRQTHTFIEIFHKKFQFFHLWTNLQKNQEFLVIFFTEGKKWNFVMKKYQ